jgi:hypothetical protein
MIPALRRAQGFFRESTGSRRVASVKSIGLFLAAVLVASLLAGPVAAAVQPQEPPTTAASSEGMTAIAGASRPLPVVAASTPESQNESGNESALNVTIRETNSPVQGGDDIQMTAAVENTGDTAVRPRIQLFVDGERQSAVITTIEPGETKLVGKFFSELTFPAARNSVVLLRVEVPDDSAERTVRVLGVPDLDGGYVPTSRTFAVAPGTRVQFEMEPAVSDSGGTRWFLDGEYRGDSTATWPISHFVPGDYWQHTFERPGTYEVTSVALGERNRRVQWTVHVTPDGNTPPSVTDVRATPNESRRLGTPDRIEIDVADAEGDLDRVLWWVTQADVRLGVYNVSGYEDTVALDSPYVCTSCSIVAWVYDENNTMREKVVWTAPRSDRPPDDDSANADGDSLPDARELELGTDPNDRDTDGDYYWDGDEVEHGFDPTDPSDHPVRDSDGDGYTNTEEIEAGTDPSDARSVPGDLRERQNSDADNLTDIRELALGTDPLEPDTDGDYYWDGDEVEHGFDPTDPSDHPVRDSDGDGYTNTEEIEAGTDPRNPNDHP